jgi:dihydroxyacetone kinase-like protein
MNEELNLDDLKKIIERIAITLDENSAYLSELDSFVGDGDHGTTVSRGFREVIKKIKENPFDDISELLKTVGLTLISSMGGASGPIFGSIFIAMAKTIEGRDKIDLKDLTRMFSDSMDKVMLIGGAKPGDKTLIDSLNPMVESLKDSSLKGLSLKDGVALAEIAALEGAESTKDMVGKKGRSKYLGERSIGYQDAGATTMYLIIKSIDDSI